MISIAVILIAFVLLGADIEVLDDRGVRRGGDTVKTLTLRVRAIPIVGGWIFDLAADGEQGLREVLGIFRADIGNTFVAPSHKSIHRPRPDDPGIAEGLVAPK